MATDGEGAGPVSSSKESAGAPTPSSRRAELGHASQTSMGGFKILKEEQVYSRYIRVYNRVVEQPAGFKPASGELSGHSHVVEYDVVASKARDSHFCCVFPFHSASRTVTLLREYSQGANAMVFTVPCGGFSDYHLSIEECARRELSEEAHLCGGQLIKLLEDGHPGLLEVKWCKNRFTPFLVINPQPDPSPHPRDAEEIIEILKLGIPELKRIMFSGDMMLPSVVTCAMALDYLQTAELL